MLTPKGPVPRVTGAGGPVLGPIPRMIAVAATSPVVGQRLRLVANSPRDEDLTTLATLIGEGRLRPVIERTYPLAEAADAIRFIESEHPGGKVVLTV